MLRTFSYKNLRRKKLERASSGYVHIEFLSQEHRRLNTGQAELEACVESVPTRPTMYTRSGQALSRRRKFIPELAGALGVVQMMQ